MSKSGKVKMMGGSDDDDRKLFEFPDLSAISTNFVKFLEQRPPIKLSEWKTLPRRRLPEEGGCGIYALYYLGRYPPYQPLARVNRREGCRAPIYVGSARTGDNAIRCRLGRHERALAAAVNLEAEDFLVRFLPVPKKWIAQAKGEIEAHFSPLWNCLLTGFGTNAAGVGRREQRLSAWDTLHGGRPEARILHRAHPLDIDRLMGRVAGYLDSLASLTPQPSISCLDGS